MYFIGFPFSLLDFGIDQGLVKSHNVAIHNNEKKLMKKYLYVPYMIFHYGKCCPPVFL